MRGKRALALALLICMAVALFPMGALAADTLSGTISNVVTEVGATAQASVLFTNSYAEGKSIEYIIPQTGSSVTKVTILNAGAEGVKIPANGNKNVFVSLDVNTALLNGASGKAEVLNVYFVGMSEPVAVPYKLSGTTKTETGGGDKEDDKDPENPNTTLKQALQLDSTDVNGNIIPAPSGNSGDRVQVVLPVINRNVNVWSFSGNKITGITITPVLSADQSKFPFVIEEVDYTRRLPDMSPGMKQELIYDFKISDKATSGVKQVDFNAVYYNNAKETYETATFAVFVNVIKGAAEEDGGMTDKDGNLITTTPKLIIESYTVTPQATGEAAQSEGEAESKAETGGETEGGSEGKAEAGKTDNRLFAGATFELAFTVRNTSEDEDIENIQITVENADGALLPAEGGSNSLYIKKIGKGGSEERKIMLQAAPDADAKSHTLAVKFAYESSKTHKSYEVTSNLSLPVAQRMRIKVDEPAIYETMVMPGQSVGVYFGLYNMGKSTIYNCMVDVEGEGLKMEESYFGGNITAGGTMRADFTIIGDTPGEIEGNILIMYEDVYGDQTVLKKPFTLTVMEQSDPGGMEMEPGAKDPGMMDPGKDAMGGQAGGGLPWWAWTLIGVGALLVIVFVITRIRKARRKKELEEI